MIAEGVDVVAVVDDVVFIGLMIAFSLMRSLLTGDTVDSAPDRVRCRALRLGVGAGSANA